MSSEVKGRIRSGGSTIARRAGSRATHSPAGGTSVSVRRRSEQSQSPWLSTAVAVRAITPSSPYASEAETMSEWLETGPRSRYAENNESTTARGERGPMPGSESSLWKVAFEAFAIDFGRLLFI